MKKSFYIQLNRIVFLVSLFVSSFAGGRAFAQFKDVSAHNISFENKFSTKIRFNAHLRSYPNRKIKPWKFVDVFNRLPKEIGDSQRIEVGSDDSGLLWTIHSENGSMLMDQNSGKVLYQSKDDQHLAITRNGKYFLAGPMGAEDVAYNVFAVPTMTKVFPKPVFLESIIGKGRFAVIEKGKGQRELVDFENPKAPIKILAKDEQWHSGVICESNNGNELLKWNKDGMTLYGLPSFRVIKTYKTQGTGIPFINGTGDIIGWIGSTCHFVNINSGENKAYQIDPRTGSELLERKTEKNDSGFSDVALGIIDLASLKEIQSFDESKATHALLSQSMTGANNGISTVICPPDSSDMWLVINRAKSWNYKNDSEGDSLLVKIGPDLLPKKVLHYSKLLLDARWDDESKTIVNMNSQDEIVQLAVEQ